MEDGQLLRTDWEFKPVSLERRHYVTSMLARFSAPSYSTTAARIIGWPSVLSVGFARSRSNGYASAPALRTAVDHEGLLLGTAMSF